MTDTLLQGEPTERELFERAWIARGLPPPSRSTAPGYTDDYDSPIAQSGWMMWQAARSLPATAAGDAGDAARLDSISGLSGTVRIDDALGVAPRYINWGGSTGLTLREAIDRATAGGAANG